MAENNHISLSQLQTMIKRTLSEGMPSIVWISAEISEVKVNASSGHCYIELVEKGGVNGIPKARASAVIWRSTYGMLSAYFKEATGGDLMQGIKILVAVSVSYNELYGLSLVVSNIDPTYTIGDIERQRRETIIKLQQDGVFDLNRELSVPLVPQRVAVISSPVAAGYQDFVNELASGEYAFKIELFDAVMQGHGAEDSIIGVLSRIVERIDDFDVVVVIRGGGSQSDLSFLNSYMLNFHVAQFPLPVITGLGHDKDQSILDMVASVSLKTPTAVAGFLLQRVAEVDNRFDILAVELNEVVQEVVEDQKYVLQRLSQGFIQQTVAIVRGAEARLVRIEREMAVLAGRVITKEGERISSLEKRMENTITYAISTESKKLETFGQIIDSRNPDEILALGFAIVRHNDKAVKGSNELNSGDEIEITLSKGRVKARVSADDKFK